MRGLAIKEVLIIQKKKIAGRKGGSVCEYECMQNAIRSPRIELAQCHTGGTEPKRQ